MDGILQDKPEKQETQILYCYCWKKDLWKLEKNSSGPAETQKDFKHHLEEGLLMYADPNASQFNEIERMRCLKGHMILRWQTHNKALGHTVSSLSRRLPEAT